MCAAREDIEVDAGWMVERYRKNGGNVIFVGV